MRIMYIHSGSEVTSLEDEFKNQGHEIVNEEPDVIIGMTVGKMKYIFDATVKYPQAKLVNYNWDVYKWVWENPRDNEYDYKRYGELLKRSDLVLCPSKCTVKRQKEWYNIDGRVVRTAVPYYEHETQDKEYILMPLREIPDEQWGWFERACEHLKLPYVTSKHHLSLTDYRKTVAECKFIVSPLHELSTGGLTLMEGYYLGKPVLQYGGEWHGGRDYFGDRSEYFNSYEELVKKLKEMYENTPKVPKDCKEWVKKHFSKKTMVKEIIHEIQRI